jgi:hypothetical protein
MKCLPIKIPKINVKKKRLFPKLLLFLTIELTLCLIMVKNIIKQQLDGLCCYPYRYDVKNASVKRIKKSLLIYNQMNDDPITQKHFYLFSAALIRK